MSDQVLHLSIISPDKRIFEGEASSVTLPGSAGSFTILAHHAPIVSSLKKGTLTYVSSGNEQTVDIEGGFIEMSNEVVTVCIY